MEPDSDHSATCDRCGREAAGFLADEALCESCYHGETSCCGGFDKDDP